RVIISIGVQVYTPALETTRILCGPAACHRIVIPEPKVHQPCICVIQPTRKSKRLKTGLRIPQHPSECIVPYFLNNRPGGGIDDYSYTPYLVRDDSICLARPKHIVRHVSTARINEATHYSAFAV